MAGVQLIKWGSITAAGDVTMAQVVGQAGSQTRAAIQALIQDVAAGIIASDPTVVAAAASGVSDALASWGIRWGDIPGYSLAVPAKDGRLGEIQQDDRGMVPQVILDRWASRMTIGGGGDTEVTEVLLVAGIGQSKATRRGVGDGAAAGFPAHPRIWFYDHVSVILKPDEGVGWLGRGFAIEWLKEHPTGIVVTVEAAVGSTGFSTTSLGTPPAGYYAGAGTWDWMLTADPNRFPQTLAVDRVAAAQAAAVARWGITPKRVGLISLGEADKANTMPTPMTAEDFGVKLRGLIAWLRGQDTNWATAPFIVGSLSYTQIYKTTPGVEYDRVMMDVPALVPLTAYDRAVSGLEENTSFNTHLVMVGQDQQGRNMATALRRAVQNDPAVVSSGAILPPANVQAHRIGSTVKVTWQHPMCRVTSFTLETSPDGVTWSVLSLPNALAIERDVTSAAAVYVRLKSTNENGSSYYSAVTGA